MSNPPRRCLVISTLAMLSLLLLATSAPAQQRNAQVSSVSLTGRVVEADGTAPADQIQVNLVCSGRLRQQTLTAPDGTFVIDLDPARDESWLDPSAGGSVDGGIEGSAVVARGRSPNLDEVPSMGRGRIALAGCEVRVAPTTEFTSNAIRLSTRGSFDNPDIGVLMLQRPKTQGPTTVSVNSLKAPEKARERFEKASKDLTEGKFDNALEHLEKAVEDYPAYSAAWDLMARAHLSQGNQEKGEECFERSIEEEPNFLPPYLGLAQVGVQSSDWTQAADWSARVLEMAPAHPQALYWNGLSSYYLNRLDQAESMLSKLYSEGHRESYPFGLLLVGVVHANQGKIQEAAEELHSYLQLMPSDQVPDEQRRQIESQLAAWQAEGLAKLADEGE